MHQDEEYIMIRVEAYSENLYCSEISIPVGEAVISVISGWH